jgi:hypothetical protein
MKMTRETRMTRRRARKGTTFREMAAIAYGMKTIPYGMKAIPDGMEALS